MINEILLRRGNQVYIEGEYTFDSKEQGQRNRILTMMKNIESLGYVFSWQLCEQLMKLPLEVLDNCYLELVTLLKKRVGADKVYQPMYPNFPQEVMEKSDEELYWNAIVHYWSFGTLYPATKKKERLPLFDETNVSILTTGTKEELLQIFQHLVSANGSLSEQDLEDIQWYFSNIPEISNYLPEIIPYKENMAYIGVCYLRYAPLPDITLLHRYFHTGTDVLRLAVALSDGDISLKRNVRFRSFSRKERRILMGLFSEASGLLEEMHKRAEVFKRLGERLHPGEFQAEQYTRVRNAFGKIRAGKPVGHFAGRVEAALLRKDSKEALQILKARPGELARRLDVLLRMDMVQPDKGEKDWCDIRLQKMQLQKEILEVFSHAAEEVSTPVLLQVRTHFQYRNQQRFRYYYPKGKLGEARMIDNATAQVEEDVCRQVVEVCEQALVKRFTKLEAMGKVYLSEALRDYIVPFNQRAAQKAAKTLVRGSKLPFDEQAKVIRGFVWWTNMENGQRVDLDLSAVIFDESWNYLEHVSYTNLRSKKYQSVHSGDIVNGGPSNGDGVTEFLDIDIDSVTMFGGRYVVYQVYSYTGQMFAILPNVSFGYMERKEVGSGEIYEPRLVRQRADMVQETVVSIPMILDCAKRQMIWCDAGLNVQNCRAQRGGINVESNLSGVALACDTMVHTHRTNLYDLVKMHVEARGEFCETKEEADMVFDVEDGITPFDTEIILAEYMQ